MDCLGEAKPEPCADKTEGLQNLSYLEKGTLVISVTVKYYMGTLYCGLPMYDYNCLSTQDVMVKT